MALLATIMLAWIASCLPFPSSDEFDGSYPAVSAYQTEMGATSPQAGVTELERSLHLYCGRYTDPRRARPMIRLGHQSYPLGLDELNVRDLQEGTWYKFVFSSGVVIGHQPLENITVLSKNTCG